MDENKGYQIPKLIAALGLTLITGFIGSLATAEPLTTWYVTLNKPYWTPPNWAFGPIWTILYILIGIAAYLVWREGLKRKDVKIALSVFALQLILNLLWSVIFFGFKSIYGGLIEIIILWITILINLILFYRISKWAGILFIPYLAWVTIASFLNYSIYILN
ncbi:MAG: tryptophan-rich sensory protein [Methanobacteriaceae archaeon]|nr:tryptophan-rich sensory protein [Methanobacteriaceae archaeon]